MKEDKFIYIGNLNGEANLISQEGHVIGICNNGEHLIVGDYGKFDVTEFLKRKKESKCDDTKSFEIFEEMLEEFYEFSRLYEEDFEGYVFVNPGFLQMAAEWVFNRNDEEIVGDFTDNLYIFNEEEKGPISDEQLANFFLTGSI